MSASPEINGRYERPAEVLLREVGDEMVALNTATEHYHSLNEVGRRCYELLSDGKTVDETTTVICAEYDAPEQQVRTDVTDLLGPLLESGLLRSTG